MNNDDITRLLLSLPDTCPYLEQIRKRFFPRQKVLSGADRLVHALIDPTFVFHFASAYARAKRPLPPQVINWAIWRAYTLLRYDGSSLITDFAGLEARTLAHPSRRKAQGLIKGLLCGCKSYAEVTRWSGLAEDVVEVFSVWYFDFVSRRNDKSFVASVINPKAELNLFPYDMPQHSALVLMQLGYQQGPEAVVRAFRLVVEQNDEDEAGQTANIKRILLTDLETKTKMRMLDAADPAFNYFKGISIAEAKHHPSEQSDDDRMGFGRISADKSCQSIIREVTQAAAVEKLRLAREFDDKESAAAEAKRRATEETVAGE